MEVAPPPFKSLLLVEDELSLADTLKIALKRLKIAKIFHAKTLEEAREILEDGLPEAVILDRSLPDGDGIDLCSELRARAYRGAILFLTARGQIEDRLEGFKSGADDYLPKPFVLEELQMRLAALARRIGKAAAQEASSQDEDTTSTELWSLDPDRLRIFGRKGWSKVTPLEFKLATHLMDAKGGVVSRETLLKEVWGFRFLPKTRTVDFFMGRLRKRFEIDADKPEHFLTVRGLGFRFSAKPESDSQG